MASSEGSMGDYQRGYTSFKPAVLTMFPSHTQVLPPQDAFPSSPQIGVYFLFCSSKSFVLSILSLLDIDFNMCLISPLSLENILLRFQD